MTWHKWLLIVKCIATAVSVASGQEYVPTIAASGGMAAVATPAPLPGPAPSNICPDCNGKGWIGDGTTKIHCKPCDGTGKLTSGSSVAAGPATVGNLSSDDMDGDAPEAVGQVGGHLQADQLTSPDLDSFYFASDDYNDAIKLWPDAKPLIVFYWPNQSKQAMVAYKNLWDRNQDGQYVVIPMCLADQWDADTYVAQHWRRHTRSVVLLDGDKQTTITDLKQLEK